MTANSPNNYIYRKWIGAIWLTLEVAVLSANIFGFTSIFKILPRYGVYDSHCISVPTRTINSTEVSTKNCDGQTKKYQDALTLGLVVFNLSSIFIGMLVDRYGCRFVKLISVILHIIGWLALAFAKSGRDYLIVVHTVFTALSGSIVLVTAYASSAYFSKSRALVSTMFAGASIVTTIWYSIFQILVKTNILTLPQLSYIWTSLGILMLISSFLFLEWEFPFLNLPYKFNVKLESSSMEDQGISSTTNSINGSTKMKWYSQIYHRLGVWKYLTSPLYIMVVLYVCLLLISVDFLAITWYPRIYYLTNQSISQADKYTNAYNFSILSGIIICPATGFLLGFGASRNNTRKILNILLMQTIAWTFSLITSIVCTFITKAVIIPSLVLNCVTRSMAIAGPQAVVATFFPSMHIGTLSGVMWTLVGVFTFVQYGLVQLTQDVPQSWKAWLIVIGLVLITLVHVVHLYSIYIQEKKKEMAIIETSNAKKFDPVIDKNQKINMMIPSTDALREDAFMTRF